MFARGSSAYRLAGLELPKVPQWLKYCMGKVPGRRHGLSNANLKAISAQSTSTVSNAVLEFARLFKLDSLFAVSARSQRREPFVPESRRTMCDR